MSRTEDYSSGVIPFRHVPGGLEIMLITSTKTGRWAIPKGHLEPQMSPLESALLEAYEEAGVRGRPGQNPLGSYTRRGRKIVVFPLEVLEVLASYPEDQVRRRCWFELSKAAAEVDEKDLKRLIVDLPLCLPLP